jgi:hypothetical protein
MEEPWQSPHGPPPVRRGAARRLRHRRRDQRDGPVPAQRAARLDRRAAFAAYGLARVAGFALVAAVPSTAWFFALTYSDPLGDTLAVAAAAVAALLTTLTLKGLSVVRNGR